MRSTYADLWSAWSDRSFLNRVVPGGNPRPTKKDKMPKTIDYFRERLKEPSTLGVIISLGLGLFGIDIMPDQKNVICGAVISILSCIGIFTKERKK